MIECFNKHNYKKIDTGDDLEDARCASAWCLGRSIHSVMMCINKHIEYIPKSPNISNIEKDLIKILYDDTMNTVEPIFISDEDMMI